MDPHAALESEFTKYYSSDELPAWRSEGADTILTAWAEESARRLLERCGDRIEELLNLLAAMRADRRHPMFDILNAATNMEWNVEDDDWRAANHLIESLTEGIAKLRRSGLGLGSLDPEGVTSRSRAYEHREADRTWYSIEHDGSTILRIDRLDQDNRTLRVEYFSRDPRVGPERAADLVSRLLLHDFMRDAYRSRVDEVVYTNISSGESLTLPYE